MAAVKTAGVTRWWIALVLPLALALPAPADTVHLTNGRAFEDVVAEVGDDEITIHLAFGTMRLPLHRVERVEAGSSSVEAYLERLERLQRSPEVDAGSWLELALWARTQGLDHGVREAARKAAELDPRLPELDPLLRSLGYVFEPELDRWIAFDEYMRSQGFVLENGLWVSREEMAERVRLAEAERDRAREQREAERAAVQQAELDLLRQQLLLNATAPPVYYQPPIYASYVGWGPVVTPPIHRPPLRPPHVQPLPYPDSGAAYRAANRAAIVSSQPGSLLPIVPQGHHGSFVSVTAAGN